MERRKIRGPDSEIRLHAVLDGVLDGIITISELGIVETFNQAAERIFGYGADEVVGHNVSMLMPEPYRTEHDGYLRNYCSSGIRKTIGIVREAVGQRKDGTTFPLDLAVSEVVLGQKRVFIGSVRDITERKQTTQELSRFKGILDNTHDMIFMFDPDTFRFTYLNNGMEEALGYTRAEMLVMCVWEINPHMPEPVFRTHVAPLLEGRTSWLKYETSHRGKNGNELPVEVSLQLVEESRGRRLFVAISRDLTDRRKVDKLKTEFISTVTHELRTPLTSIRGALGLVRGGVAGEMSKQAKSIIEIAYNNTERLVRLINDILDIEKIQSGKMQFALVKAELMPLIEHALEANHHFGEKFLVRFTLAGGRPGANVLVDPDRLAQVMANLLSNAAKFSPPHAEVVVAVSSSGGRLRVAVSDHGGGIPEEFRERIFQKFSQADSSDTRTKGGTGLGLSITKAIIEGMGGVIGFDSVLGQGTTFYFELPDADAQEQQNHKFFPGRPQARRRLRYIPLYEAQAGMMLGAPVSIAHQGILRFSLPARHALTADNLRQLGAHQAEFIFIAEPDTRADEQVAEDVAQVAHRVLDIFSNADLSDPTMAALFDQVLVYRSA